MTPRVSDFFASNMGTKAISVVIAIVLWIIVLGSRNVEVTKEVTLEVITSSEMVAANEIPEKVGFRLSGPKAFLRTILDRREEPIRVNLTGNKPGLVTHRFFSDSIRVPIGVKVVSIHPNAVLVKLENIKKREVAVRAQVSGVPPQGFRVSKVEIQPPTIKIKGAESRVDAVAELFTLPVDVTGMTESSERNAVVDVTRHAVQIDGPAPRILIQMETASANFRIKKVDIRVLTPFNAKLTEKTVTVLVRAAPKDLSSLDRSKVFGVVDMQGKGKGQYTEKVVVSVPPNISLVKVIPELVNVVLY